MGNNPKKPIYVTKPYLPPLNEFIPYLNQIWENRVLTNHGPIHEEFERVLKNYLGVGNVSLFCNGTTALLTAIKAKKLRGEVVTTPYSFVATANSLLWNDITPVFVDIEENFFNIDPGKIEEAITDKTTAILAVHCYGNPCDVEAIEDIAKRHELETIYDAAHAFAVRDSVGSILRYGNLSVLSFHATKIFNTFEGGAVVCNDKKTKETIDRLKNFGFVDEVTVLEAGINGKMSEFNAALGMVQLRHLENVLHLRQKIDRLYRTLLNNVEGITIPKTNLDVIRNYAYFPVLINPEYPLSRDDVYKKLAENSIYARRYFYPLISNMPMYKALPSANRDNLPVANQVSNQILCLPIYPDLPERLVEKICSILKIY